MKLILIFAALIFSVTCKKMSSGNTTSACIQRYIDSNKANIDWPVSSVDEYEFQGKLVYAFNPPKNYADAPTLIKSFDCKNMCSIGGFAGPRNNSCNGDNFFEKAKLKRRIWSR